MDSCRLCNVERADGHLSTDIHRFNYILYQWKNYRKALVKNREGIIISESVTSKLEPLKEGVTHPRKGKHSFTVTPDQFKSVKNKVTFEITVTNNRTKDIYYIMKATILVPFRHFIMRDHYDTVNNKNPIELQPKGTYKYTVEFSLNSPLRGSYKIPIAFTFQSATEDPDHFTIARQMVVIISDVEQLENNSDKTPFKNGVWDDIMLYIPCVKTPTYPKEFPIPERYKKVLQAGLNELQLSLNDKELLDFVRNCICPGYFHTGKVEPSYPNDSNYKDFYHFLLWLDEIGQKIMLQRYNMSNVTMTIIPTDMLELEVPGLAEKRPSLIGGDLVRIRLAGHRTAYSAIVKTINDKTIWIHNMHIDVLDQIKQNKDVKFDIAFELNRLSYERMHKAVDNCVTGGLLPLLFPNVELKNRSVVSKYKIPNERFFNKSILNNEEQKIAVRNIVNCTSLYAPYIVFGPPGTGKTLTIVEAILQIKQNLPNVKILVCAPANAACDMLTSKLIKFTKKKSRIIRVHTESRNWNDVPSEIKPYSNHDGKQYIKMNSQDIARYNIVITTLVLIGKYAYNQLYEPDFVFIDEAAQAMEPEANIAISMLSIGKQLILAGDPKQLGPQCGSAVAASFKLENSILERLMSTNPLYQDENNNRFITMLKLNYRSHPMVLQVPNDLFYFGKLQAVNQEAANDPISGVFIHPLIEASKNENTPVLKSGLPIEFCAVHAKERRHGKSPSYFNESELQMVLKYVKVMKSLTNIRVEESEIGVVTPYIRQVHRIKERLRQEGLNIEVGTTEAFQGREKRILIISTVRAQHDLLLVDKQYKLGFVQHAKRMNVALTRAKSKLIVIGHPHVLSTCSNWRYFIEFCEARNAYFGAQNLKRTDEVKADIMARFTDVPILLNVKSKNKRREPRRSGSGN